MKNIALLLLSGWLLVFTLQGCRVAKYRRPNSKVYTYPIEDNSILGRLYLNIKPIKLVRDKRDGMQWVEGILQSGGWFPIDSARINYGNSNGDTTFMHYTSADGSFKLSINKDDTIRFSKDGYHDLYMHFHKPNEKPQIIDTTVYD